MWIVKAQSTVTVISGRNTGHQTIDIANDQTTSELNNQDRTSEIVVGSQRPVSRDGQIRAQHKVLKHKKRQIYCSHYTPLCG